MFAHVALHLFGLCPLALRGGSMYNARQPYAHQFYENACYLR